MEEKAITVHTNSLWGEGHVGLPERPDKSSEQRQAERVADRVPYRKVLQRFGWDDAMFSDAKAYGFPTFVVRNIKTGEVSYQGCDIEAWRERLLTFADTLR